MVSLPSCAAHLHHIKVTTESETLHEFLGCRVCRRDHLDWYHCGRIALPPVFQKSYDLRKKKFVMLLIQNRYVFIGIWIAGFVLSDDWTYSDTHCDADWLPNNGFCYRLGNESDSWDNAHMKCKALSSDLLSIHSLADVEVVITKLHNEGKF